MEGAFGGGLKKARAELGVASFGMQVVDPAPRTMPTTPTRPRGRAMARRRSTSGHAAAPARSTSKASASR